MEAKYQIVCHSNFFFFRWINYKNYFEFLLLRCVFYVYDVLLMLMVSFLPRIYCELHFLLHVVSTFIITYLGLVFTFVFIFIRNFIDHCQKLWLILWLLFTFIFVFYCMKYYQALLLNFDLYLRSSSFSFKLSIVGHYY